MKTALIAIAATAVAAGVAHADDSFETAKQLGSVIGSEAACNLTYNQAAIEKYIRDKVAEDDAEFTSTLNLMAQGTEFHFAKISASAKTAHCTQIRRVAKSFGFID